MTLDEKEVGLQQHIKTKRYDANLKQIMEFEIVSVQSSNVMCKVWLDNVSVSIKTEWDTFVRMENRWCFAESH